MDQITLRADTGRETGKRPSRRLRREGKVPATIYGRGIDAIKSVRGEATTDIEDLKVDHEYGKGSKK